MKILLDHNLDWRLSNHLGGHEVSTALEMAWEALKNGALLTEAEKFGFSALITADKGIKDQQTMKGRSIGVVIIRASNNRLDTQLPMIPEVLQVLTSIKPGQIIASNRTPEKLKKFSHETGIAAAADNLEVVQKASVIFLFMIAGVHWSLKPPT